MFLYLLNLIGKLKYSVKIYLIHLQTKYILQNRYLLKRLKLKWLSYYPHFYHFWSTLFLYVDLDFLLVSDSCLKNFIICLVWVMNIGNDLSQFFFVWNILILPLFLEDIFSVYKIAISFFFQCLNNIIPFSSAWHSFFWQVWCPSQICSSAYIFFPLTAFKIFLFVF